MKLVCYFKEPTFCLTDSLYYSFISLIPDLIFMSFYLLTDSYFFIITPGVSLLFYLLKSECCVLRTPFPHYNENRIMYAMFVSLDLLWYNVTTNTCFYLFSKCSKAVYSKLAREAISRNVSSHCRAVMPSFAQYLDTWEIRKLIKCSGPSLSLCLLSLVGLANWTERISNV